MDEAEELSGRLCTGTEWRQALDKFLAQWISDPCVVGILVCGSFVTGGASEHSDIDVHIVTDDEQSWRERGNRIIDGFLIEYFINPVRQIKRYFQEDHDDMRSDSMVQFITGEIIFERDSAISNLKEHARQWFERPQAPLPDQTLELMKYGIWDMLDNLEACFESGAPDFPFNYHVSLYLLFEKYCQFMRMYGLHFHQLHRYLTDRTLHFKYLQQEFPDREFASQYVMALEEGESSSQMQRFQSLARHVLHKMGGFSIGDFTVRTSLPEG